MKWAFQIERTSLDRRNLIDLLKTLGYEWVELKESEFAFCSTSLDTCINADEVWEDAKRMRELISKVTEIDPELVLGPVIDLSSETPKRHHFLEAEPFTLNIKMGTATLTVSPPSNLSPEQLEEWKIRKDEQEYQNRLETQLTKLEPAFREPRAAKVLQILKQSSHSGESLYKIYELLEGHPSHRKEFQQNFSISETDFKRFSDAVHNPVVSGQLARHAYEEKPKTANPMSIAEAESFILSIAKRWMASLRK